MKPFLLSLTLFTGLFLIVGATAQPTPENPTYSFQKNPGPGPVSIPAPNPNPIIVPVSTPTPAPSVLAVEIIGPDKFIENTIGVFETADSAATGYSWLCFGPNGVPLSNSNFIPVNSSRSAHLAGPPGVYTLVLIGIILEPTSKQPIPITKVKSVSITSATPNPAPSPNPPTPPNPNPNPNPLPIPIPPGPTPNPSPVPIQPNVAPRVNPLLTSLAAQVSEWALQVNSTSPTDRTNESQKFADAFSGVSARIAAGAIPTTGNFATVINDETKAACKIILDSLPVQVAANWKIAVLTPIALEITKRQPKTAADHQRIWTEVSNGLLGKLSPAQSAALLDFTCPNGVCLPVPTLQTKTQPTVIYYPTRRR